MVENLDVDVEMDIERLLIERAENADTLYRVGASLADLLLKKLSFARRSVHVSASAVDIDVIFSGFAERMRDNKVTVSLSCYWNKLIPADAPGRNGTPNFVPDIAPVFHQFHEDDVGDVDYVVAISSTSREPAVIVENLRRTAARFRNTSLITLLPTSSQEDLVRLIDHARYRGLRLPSMFLGLNSGNVWSPWLRSLGWGCDQEDSPHRHSMPAELQSLFQKQILRMAP
ncbi:hypothetical protein IB270_34695 [Ensifer sp. ENS05]|uniref:hypothetical protein n=1 Tax=Ensifer sp. ENS05 TaxID=2769277 RepID=UPI0017858C91|nr:hypothetical protein [Ensifer sp. ENS05]MBD9597976.1 hypothetical protein [Ensifer sp. ENS05]